MFRRFLALTVLVALPACGIGAQPQPQPLPAAPAPLTPPVTSDPSLGRPVVVYLVDAQGLLRGVEVTGPTGPYVSSSLQALLQIGASLAPPPGLRSLVPRGTSLGRVVVYPTDVRIDIGPEFLALSGQDQVLATAQVVFTATDRRPQAKVSLFVDGRDIPVPVGDGSLQDDPVVRDDYAGLVPAEDPPT